MGKEHSSDHYYYRKSLQGLEKGKIYFHLETSRYFFLKRFIDSFDRNSHFVEFYEIEYYQDETDDIEMGVLSPVRKFKKRTYIETISDFKENFTRLTYPNRTAEVVSLQT